MWCDQGSPLDHQPGAAADVAFCGESDANQCRLRALPNSLPATEGTD
jgi:hypothetical protein